MIDVIRALSDLPGISGNETAVRQFILQRARETADEVTVDPAGSVIALKKGTGNTGRRIMISARMDETGLMITDIRSDGLLRFTAVGRPDAKALCGRRVYTGDRCIPGVIGILPIHLAEGDAREKYPDIDSMMIDIGADSREEAQAALSIGDCCVFSSRCESFGDGLIAGKALARSAGCAILLDLMSGSYAGDVYFAFLSTDMVGGIGAACAAYSAAPDIAVDIDAVPAGDFPGADKCACSLRSGAVISYIGGRVPFDRALCDKALELAGGKDIAVQVNRIPEVIGDRSEIISSRGGVRALSVGLPCRYPRAPISVMAQTDIEAARRLTGELLCAL